MMHFLMEQLEEQGYVTRHAVGSEGLPVRLTASGWNRVAELERGLKNEKPRQGFVAMWFAKKGRQERESGLSNGVQAAGYDPYIVDNAEFRGKVDDRIIAEIRKSRFIVADFTGQRQNVYYEAGFAEGAGISVIYTCHKKDVRKCHFDMRQQNIIVWETAGDLAERLQRRIERVIGPPPK